MVIHRDHAQCLFADPIAAVLTKFGNLRHISVWTTQRQYTTITKGRALTLDLC